MSQPNIGNELRNAAVEPLLPIEKKLIGWKSRRWSRPSDRARRRQPLLSGIALTPSHYDDADRAAEK